MEMPWECHDQNTVDLTLTVEEVQQLSRLVKGNAVLQGKLNNLMDYIQKRKNNEWDFVQQGYPFNEQWHLSGMPIGKYLSDTCYLKQENTVISYRDKSVGFITKSRTDEQTWEVYQIFEDGKHEKIGSCRGERIGGYTVSNPGKPNLIRSYLHMAVLTCFMRSKHVKIEQLQT